MRPAAALTAAEWEARLVAAGVAAEGIPGLVVYLTLLERFKDALDLVGPGTADTLVRDHVVESLAGARHLRGEGELVDVGSGAGLPGVPLLIACPRWRGTLVEPRERRWAFLREVVREVGLSCEVRRARVAECEGAFDALAVRALAVDVWGPAAPRMVRSGGLVLWWTTQVGLETARLEGFEPVVTSPLPDRRRGSVVVLSRRST